MSEENAMHIAHDPAAARALQVAKVKLSLLFDYIAKKARIGPGDPSFMVNLDAAIDLIFEAAVLQVRAERAGDGR